MSDLASRTCETCLWAEYDTPRGNPIWRCRWPETQLPVAVTRELLATGGPTAFITETRARSAMAFTADVERMFGYDAESWQETNANFLALFAQQNTIISFVVAAILAVGGFGILAIQIMIVLQKTRDIAILRSVGFRRSDILSAFLLQGAIIAMIGAVVGDLAGHYVIVALSHLKTHQEGLVKSETFLEIGRAHV